MPGIDVAQPPVPLGQDIETVLDKARMVRGHHPQWSAECWMHDDVNPSLSIRVTDSGKVLLHCHGCTPTDEQGRTDWFIDAIKLLDKGARGSRPVAVRERMRRYRKRPARDDRTMVTAREHAYRSQDGKRLLARKVRLHFLDAVAGQVESKGWRWERREGGQWVASLGGIVESNLPLYLSWTLPKLTDDQPIGHVYLCEGERDADSLTTAGHLAVSVVGGASAHKTFTDQHLASISGYAITVVADNDSTGHAHAERMRDLLAKCGSEVHVVRPPAPHNDVTELLDAGGTVADLELLDVAQLEPELEPELEPPVTTMTPVTAMTADPMDGAALLDALRAELLRFVVLPSEVAADAVVLWIAATYGMDAWETAPRLMITAPNRRCGKSRLLDMLEATVYRPLGPFVSPSAASLFRSITDEDSPTMLVDEYDTIFSRGDDGTGDLRALINAGHQRGRTVPRIKPKSLEVEEWPTFAMMALSGIGRLPDTVEDRSIIIRMRRRLPSEECSEYRTRHHRAGLQSRGSALGAWVRDEGILKVLAEPIHGMPVQDRAADTWEPLFAVAYLAGDDWPERVRRACLSLCAEADHEDEPTLAVRLLMDLRPVMAMATNSTAITPSKVMLEGLKTDSESFWHNPDGYGIGLSAPRMAKLLAEYGIRPVRTTTERGFRRSQFIEVWERYCQPEPEPEDD